jgi:hypothetical protein
LKKLKYFLAIEIAHLRENSLFLSSKKYVLNLLKKIDKLNVKPTNTPKESNKKNIS